ncbi:lipocalin family protein [Apibacter adventoris]|uniref:Lipocalin-like domain-containing protein n=1 Tax=Apibacter adventoris TaxID=1679466 RepID=A0A2S8A8U5_9FLAO|nr:lipocalin family protein [Apibacter adventoris]PQL90981.1 hypothetical protein C4S77_08960 [Apibacter adventoris]
MKKIIFLGILSLFLVYSCKTTIDRSSQRQLIGTWNLDKVTYSDNFVKVKAFDEYDAQCLKNSTWYFVSNNNTGNFTLPGGNDCPSYTQKFTWYIDPQGMLGLKLINEGERARKVTTGTIYQVQNISDTEFNLNQVISGVKITYHFSQLSKGKLK